MKFSFYPLDVEYKIVEDRALIYLYGKTEEGKKICLIDDSFKPYFWVIPKSDPKSAELEIKSLSVEGVKIIETKIKNKKYFGEEKDCIRVTLETPQQVPLIRNYLDSKNILHAESDILFSRRYLLDKEIIPFQEYEVEVEEASTPLAVPAYKLKSIEAREGNLENYKILSFDIESYPTKDRSMNAPILMIAFHSSNYNKVITWRRFKTDLKNIEFVNSEAELLEKFKQIVEDQDPDIITGYFTDGFDFPMINERAKKYKVKLDLGLDRSNLKFGKGIKPEAKISGIPHLDVFSLHRNVLRQGLNVDDLKLDSVAKELLGEKKREVNILDLSEAWENNDEKKLSEFADYNLQDAKITYQLAEKLMPAVIEMTKIVGLTLDDVSRMSVSQLIEHFLIKNEEKYNEIAPNKPKNEEIKKRQLQRLKGAFVFEPKPNLYKDIMVFDFRSLYPTIIASHNLSGSSLNCDCCSEGEQVPLEGKKIWFCKKKKAFLPTMIEDLIKRRMRVKEIMREKSSPFLKAREQGLKLLANSFYGYLAFYGSRWYSFEAGSSTTAYARHYIKKSIAQYEEAGFQVIYSDTDSVFITLNENKKKEDAISLMKEINKDLPGLMELEFEGFFTSGIFVSTHGDVGAKKRYALIDEKDKLTVKGFATVRRNTSQIAKKIQLKVLNIILKENNTEKAVKYVKDEIKKIRNKELSIENFVIKTKITRELGSYEATGPHVAVAQRLKEKGYDIGPGSMIEYVITENGKKIRDRARELEEAKKEDIDAEYYITHQIIPNIEKIFEVLGYDTTLLIDKDQQSLGSFF